MPRLADLRWARAMIRYALHWLIVWATFDPINLDEYLRWPDRPLRPGLV